MKRSAVIVLSLLAVVGIVTSVFAQIRKGHTMQVLFSKRDLPDHGVRLITPVDPSFDATASKHFNGKSPAMLKPFSVFIQNSSGKVAVAYALTWKFVKENGKVIEKTVGYSEPGILMGNEIPQDPSFKHTTAIESGAVRCFTWDSKIEPDMVETSGVADTSSSNQPQQVQDDNSNILRAMLSAELTQATDLMVSLDGVVFDDGTFVGSNLIFFQQIQAAVNAKVDLLREVAQASERGTIDQALESITSKSLEPDVVFSQEFSADDYYRYYRKIYAKEISGMTRVYGKERMVPRLLESFHRARPILTKE
jgi:hypothetical protein